MNGYRHITMIAILLLSLSLPQHLAAQREGCNIHAYLYGKKDRDLPNYWLGWSLAVMDINKDGYADILASAVGPNTTFVYFGGPGIFDTTADMTLRGGAEMVVGDFNGDGLQDLAIRRHGYWTEPRSLDSFYVYMGIADGEYAIDIEPTFILVAPESSSGGSLHDSQLGRWMFAADLTGDGSDELILAHQNYYDRMHALGTGAIFVWRYPREGEADTLVYIPISDAYMSSLSRIEVGDINGDGLADIQITVSEYAGVAQYLGLRIRTALGRRGRYPDLSRPDHFHTSEELGFHGRNALIVRTALLDVNNDGMADMLWTPFADSLLIMYGTPEGLSGKVDRIIVNPSPRKYEWGFGPYHTRIGDYDGDGHDDFRLTLMPWGGWPGSVVFGGNSNGLTDQAHSVCVGGGDDNSHRYYFSIGDITGNGGHEHITSTPTYQDLPQQQGYVVVIKGMFTPMTEVEQTAPALPEPFAMAVYPSPVTDDINIQLHGEPPGRYHLRLYSLDGRTLYSRDYELTRSDNLLLIRGSELPSRLSSGVYMLDLRTGGVTVTRKLLLEGR
jgi:hypothetical protein